MSKHRKPTRAIQYHPVKNDPPKKISKRYHVTSQTAYHVTQIALQEGITEGHVIDKLMRTYLASR